LSVRVARTVASDYTVKWQGQRWGVPREAVCAGLRRARVQIERRLDGGTWLRLRTRYLPLRLCPAATPSLSAVSLRLTAGSKPNPKPRKKYHPPPEHPWRRPWKRTFLLCVDSSRSVHSSCRQHTPDLRIDASIHVAPAFTIPAVGEPHCWRSQAKVF